MVYRNFRAPLQALAHCNSGSSGHPARALGAGDSVQVPPEVPSSVRRGTRWAPIRRAMVGLGKVLSTAGSTTSTTALQTTLLSLPRNSQSPRGKHEASCYPDLETQHQHQIQGCLPAYAMPDHRQEAKGSLLEAAIRQLVMCAGDWIRPGVGASLASRLSRTVPGRQLMRRSPPRLPIADGNRALVRIQAQHRGSSNTLVTSDSCRPLEESG